MDHGRGVVRRKLVLSGAARHHADPDVAGAAGPGLLLRLGLQRWRRSPADCSAISSAPCSTTRAGQWLISLYGYGDKVEAFRAAYAQYGSLIILLKGLTPIPYKIVTITSGFAGFNLGLFIILSLITRGARFFVEAFLLNRYGARARTIIEKRLGLWTGLAAVGVVIGFIVVVRVF